MKNKVYTIYRTLYEAFGPQHWWPGDSIEEIIIGAVLTQNTNWDNVKKAITNLKNNNSLSLAKIAKMELSDIAFCIRPSGYFNIKARRLQSVAEYFTEKYDNNFEAMKQLNPDELRKELLGVHGVGEETADSILLYALYMPVFVVDAYTRRMGERHNLFPKKSSYSTIKQYFEKNLSKDVYLFNEFHALIVHLGKHFCKPKPGCNECPLKKKNGNIISTKSSFR